MLLALDTSVIVAGALAGHAFHPRASVWQTAIHRGEVQAMVCAHALAEVYSVLSKVEESRSLARVLEAAHKPAQYIEFDGGHVVPAEVVRALAAFATVRSVSR